MLLSFAATVLTAAAVVNAQVNPNNVSPCLRQCTIQVSMQVGCDNGPLDTQCVCVDKKDAFTMAAFPCLQQNGCDITEALNLQTELCSKGVDCQAPFFMCGTLCIDPTMQSCQSGVPITTPPVKRGAKRGIPKCEPRETLCDVGSFFQIGVEAAGLEDFTPSFGPFECIDTTNNLEACGGCPGTGGVDCTALFGVADVSCQKSKCVVTECNTGLTLINGQCK